MVATEHTGPIRGQRGQVVSRPGARSEAELLGLVGAAESFVTVVALIRKVASCDATVLIQGETGTGKEVAARAIHYLGRRRDRPFVPVNCGAIPDTLVESEFFGHVRGAFTDARDACWGLIATAEGGTLFLDEVETLQPRAQVTLLRFLQDRVYRPVGGRQLVPADVRIVAASNAPIADLVAAGTFRADLMYRLAIMSVRMPSLRERPGDVALLARHFVAEFAMRYGTVEKRLAAASIAALEHHEWPGNVRELENFLHSEFLLAEGDEMTLPPPRARWDAMPAGGSGRLHAGYYELEYRHARQLALDEFEKTYLCRALARSGGNVSQAARLAGKERRAFGRLIKKHGINRHHYAE